jgi:hypothetical protein
MIITKETNVNDVGFLLDEVENSQVAYIMKSILIKDGRDISDIPLNEWLDYVNDAHEYSALCQDVLWNLDSQNKS